ncbi:MAG: hypothetical protein RSA65_01960, partial [Clostridia bacterium]
MAYWRSRHGYLPVGFSYLQYAAGDFLGGLAISRMVSFCLAKDDPRNAKRVFRIALSFLTVVGFIAMLIMIVMSPVLARRSGDLGTQPGFVAIAPALLLVCTLSAFRGFMQGQQNMVPTAISQLIEQVG